jgi:HK97 family phage portal protein
MVLAVHPDIVSARAIKSQLEDLILALDRQGATARDLARVYAVSVIAYRAANFRARVVAQVPFRLVDRNDKPVKNHALNQVFCQHPSRYDLMERSELTMCFWGHNLLYKKRAWAGRISHLQWLNPQLYTRRVDPQYGLLGFDLRGYGSEMMRLDRPYIRRSDGVFMHGFDFDDDFGGVSPAEVAFDAAGVETEARLTAVSFLRNRAVPLAIAQPKEPNEEIPEEGRRSFIEFLRQMAKGARNAGRTFVSRGGRWDWVQVQQQFDQIGMESLTQQAREDLSMAFDMPLDLLLPTSSSYAELYQSNKAWVDYFVRSRCTWYAMQLNMQLAPEFDGEVRLEPDFSQVLRDDQSQLTDVANKQIGGGYLDLYSAQVTTKARTPDERLRDIYIIRGVPMSAEAIADMAQNPVMPEWQPGEGSQGIGDYLVPPDQLPPQPAAAVSAPVHKRRPAPAAEPSKSDAAAQWLPENVFTELRNCVHVFGRRGTAYDFEGHLLSSDVVAFVRLLMSTGDEPEQVLEAARAYWLKGRDLDAFKAYGDVERVYRAALFDLIRAAFARQVNRKEFGDLGRAEISTAYEAAFKQGLADVGVLVERLEAGEAAFIQEQAKAERRYWTRLANDVYGTLVPLVEQIQTLTDQVHATGDPERKQELRTEILALKNQLIAEREKVLKRLDLWMQSLRTIYSQGQLAGKRNQMLLWEADLTAENCRSCRALHGQIHRASSYDQYGLYPGSSTLECVVSAKGVKVCKCRFRVTTEKARGKLSRVPLYAGKGVHVHHADPALRADLDLTAGYVVLYLTATDSIAQAQQDLIEQRPDLDPMPVDLLHVTLAYAPEVSDAHLEAIFQALALQGLPSLQLNTREVAAFENDGERAIVALVDRAESDAALWDVQRAVYETFTARGITLSHYSQPEAWQPHITLGHEWPDGPFEPYALAAPCAVDYLAVARDNYWAVYELPAGAGEVES